MENPANYVEKAGELAEVLMMDPKVLPVRDCNMTSVPT